MLLDLRFLVPIYGTVAADAVVQSRQDLEQKPRASLSRMSQSRAPQCSKVGLPKFEIGHQQVSVIVEGVRCKRWKIREISDLLLKDRTIRREFQFAYLRDAWTDGSLRNWVFEDTWHFIPMSFSAHTCHCKTMWDSSFHRVSWPLASTKTTMFQIFMSYLLVDRT